MLDGIIEDLTLDILDMNIIFLIEESLKKFIIFIIYMLSMTTMIENCVYPCAYSHDRFAMSYT